MIGFSQGSNFEQSLKYPIILKYTDALPVLVLIWFHKNCIPCQVFLRAEI